jgi:hypothetical protein
MSYDGLGNYSVPAGTAAVGGAVIDSVKYNNLLIDLQTALTKALLRDGQGAALAHINLGGFKILNLAPGVAGTDAANFGQLQGMSANLLTSVANADTITANVVPLLTAYALGQVFYLIPTAVNTVTGVTLAISGLPAKAITRKGALPLAVGELVVGTVYQLYYDGTQFQIISQMPSSAVINLAQLWTAQQRPFYKNTDTISATGTYTFDANTKGQVNAITLTNAITVTFGAPANIVEGAMYKLILLAGDTSVRVFAWNSAYKFPSAVSPLVAGATSLNALDIITFLGGPGNTLIYDGVSANVR